MVSKTVKLSHILALVSTGSVSWLAGSAYERLKRNGQTVQAASIAPTGLGRPVSESLPDVVPQVNRTAQIMKYGFPGYDQIRSMDNYVMSYDRKNRTAHWVFEHLTRDKLGEKNKVDRAKCSFQEDTSIHPFFRSTNDDYKGSGYDRGHLAAAGNHRLSQTQCEQTFLLSNMAPQVGKGFNRTAWNKLEKYVRHLTKLYKNVYVCTGPLYLPRKETDGKMYVKYEVIGRNSVAVPTHFFKVVVCETAKNEIEMEAYVMPNAVIDDNTSVHSFQVPIESIERSAGMIFFDQIPRETFKRINGRKVTFV